jgi:hypothetical protein
MHAPDSMMAAAGFSRRSRKSGRASMAALLHSSSVASRKCGRASTGSTRSASQTSLGEPLRLITSRSTLRKPSKQPALSSWRTCQSLTAAAAAAGGRRRRQPACLSRESRPSVRPAIKPAKSTKRTEMTMKARRNSGVRGSSRAATAAAANASRHCSSSDVRACTWSDAALKPMSSLRASSALAAKHRTQPAARICRQ